MPSRESRQADPSRGQNASELPMREQRYIPFEIEQFLKQPVSAIRDLLGGFAVRASVSPNVPVRSGFADVDGELSLVIAIVPFLQIRREFRRRRQSGQFACLSRAQARAGENPGESDLTQGRLKLSRHILAMRGQWNIRSAGMPAGDRPLGFAVSNEVKL